MVGRRGLALGRTGAGDSIGLVRRPGAPDISNQAAVAFQFPAVGAACAATGRRNWKARGPDTRLGQRDGEKQTAGAQRDGKGDEITLQMAHDNYSVCGCVRLALLRLRTSSRSCNTTKPLENQLRKGL